MVWSSPLQNSPGQARRAALAMLVGYLTLSCSGEASSADEEVVPDVRFDEIYQTVFSRALCGESKCHGEENRGGDLDLRDQETAYGQLVGETALGPKCLNLALKRVEPGKPEESLLFLKLAHDSSPCGDVMPPVAIVLTDEELLLLENWIKNGAPE